MASYVVQGGREGLVSVTDMGMSKQTWWGLGVDGQNCQKAHAQEEWGGRSRWLQALMQCEDIQVGEERVCG